jgi:hypothetical protein
MLFLAIYIRYLKMESTYNTSDESILLQMVVDNCTAEQFDWGGNS